MRALLPLCAVVMLSGCFAIADLDRFDTEGGGGATCDVGPAADPPMCSDISDTSMPRDLKVDLRGFEQCVDQRIELRVVNRTFTSVARAVIEGSSAAAHFVMVKAIPPGDHTVDLYVDTNDDGEDQVGEPSWREMICPDGVFAFRADDSFQSIGDPDTRDLGGDFMMHMRDMIPHVPGEQALRVAVVEVGSGQTVGYFLLPDINDPNFDVYIPGIIVNGLSYRIDLTADANQNGVYDPPPMDHGWTRMESGTSEGIELTFVHNTDFTDVARSFPRPD